MMADIPRPSAAQEPQLPIPDTTILEPDVIATCAVLGRVGRSADLIPIRSRRR